MYITGICHEASWHQGILGALAFTFVDPEEARTWADTYYSVIKSEGGTPNACTNQSGMSRG